MDNKVHDILEAHDMSISFDEAEGMLRRIQEKNKENELKQVEYKTILSENRKEIEKQLSVLGELEDMVDLSRLSDKDYLEQTIVMLGRKLEEDKVKFKQLADRASRELGGN